MSEVMPFSVITGLAAGALLGGFISAGCGGLCGGLEILNIKSCFCFSAGCSVLSFYAAGCFYWRIMIRRCCWAPPRGC